MPTINVLIPLCHQEMPETRLRNTPSKKITVIAIKTEIIRGDIGNTIPLL